MHQNIRPQFTLTFAEKQQLLDIARRAIDAATRRRPLPPIDLDKLPAALRQPAACFVTLHIDGALRGCTGSLAARYPLAEEVSRIAVQTALHDPRFTPVTHTIMPQLDIEISVLTAPVILAYDTPDDLISKLRPGVDGVILRRGSARATFLPQVWERVQSPERFLDLLSQKMGFSAGTWRESDVTVEVYQVIAWRESTLAEEE